MVHIISPDAEDVAGRPWDRRQQPIAAGGKQPARGRRLGQRLRGGQRSGPGGDQAKHPPGSGGAKAAALADKVNGAAIFKHDGDTFAAGIGDGGEPGHGRLPFRQRRHHGMAERERKPKQGKDGQAGLQGYGGK